MRADSGRPANPDFPWRTAIRMEMEMWQPERLPARFRPRSRCRFSGSPRCVLRSVAAVASVLVAAAITYVVVSAPQRVTTTVEFVANTAARLAEAPAPTATPTAAPAVRSIQPLPATSGRPPAVPVVPAEASPAVPTPQSMPSAPASPQPSPEPSPSDTPDGLLGAGPLAPPTPSDPAEPSPSPSQICLPILPLCL